MYFVDIHATLKFLNIFNFNSAVDVFSAAYATKVQYKNTQKIRNKTLEPHLTYVSPFYEVSSGVVDPAILITY